MQILQLYSQGWVGGTNIYAVNGKGGGAWSVEHIYSYVNQQWYWMILKFGICESSGVARKWSMGGSDIAKGRGGCM